MAPNEKLAWELPVWLVVFLMLLSRFSFCFWLLIVWLWYFDWGVDIMVFVLLRVCQASYMCWSGFCQVWWVISHYFFDYTFWPFSSLFSCSFCHCMWRCILVLLTVSTSLWHFISLCSFFCLLLRLYNLNLSFDRFTDCSTRWNLLTSSFSVKFFSVIVILTPKLLLAYLK